MPKPLESNTMGILEKIAEIEREIARTQKNKGELQSQMATNTTGGADNTASQIAMLAKTYRNLGLEFIGNFILQPPSTIWAC